MRHLATSAFRFTLPVVLLSFLAGSSAAQSSPPVEAPSAQLPDVQDATPTNPAGNPFDEQPNDSAPQAAGSIALADGKRHLQQGELAQAITALGQAISDDPDSAEAYFQRGIAWFRSGEFEIAKLDFYEVLRIDSSTAEPHVWMGMCLVRLGLFQEAVHAYSHAISRDDRNLAAFVNRGLAHMALNEPRKASLDFVQAIRLQPQNGRYFFFRGNALAAQGLLRSATESYARAHELDPELAAARYNHAVTLAAINDAEMVGQRRRALQLPSDSSRGNGTANYSAPDGW